ncbi:ADP-ribosylglycohydrolase family protein [Candidatus Woesearchaeota archaeon]|nr:ADP-ribosylglycohydrolase family protein [Candidatus Woesearchaeota archaeon]
MELIERYIAALLGCAIGDTLGMAVEGWKPEQIKKYAGKITHPIAPIIPTDNNNNMIFFDEFGTIKSWTRYLKKGNVTDDTIFTLALAETIVEKGLDLDYCAKKHVEYYNKHGDSGFGGTTRDAMQNLINNVSPLESGVIGGPGTACCMKMHPLGLYANATYGWRNAYKFAKSVGKMTHLDPRSIASGICQAEAVNEILMDKFSKKEFLENVYQTCVAEEEPLTEEHTWYKAGNLADKLEWVWKNREIDEEEAYNKLGSSSAVYRAYPFAIFMFQKYWDDPLNGLIATVNYGGDCDTTGAIFSALAGARHGRFWPEEWEQELQYKKELITAAELILRLPDDSDSF